MTTYIFKKEPYISAFVPESKMSQLQNECLSVRHHLFYNNNVGYDYNYMSFAPVDETLEEERRINILSDNIVRFSFYSHRSLSFQLGESTKRYYIKASHNFGALDVKDTSKTNPYLRVSRELSKALTEYDTMVSFYNSFNWTSFAKKKPSVEDCLENDTSSRTNAKSLFHHINEIPLDYYHFTPLRMIYNECARSASPSICLTIEVDECSRIYCHFVGAAYEGARLYFEEKSFEKDLEKEFNNLNNTFKMKEYNNFTTNTTNNSIEANVNVDVNLIVSCLISVMDENSDISRFCRSMNITVSKVLESATKNVISCTIQDGRMELIESVTNSTLSFILSSDTEKNRKTMSCHISYMLSIANNSSKDTESVAIDDKPTCDKTEASCSTTWQVSNSSDSCANHAERLYENYAEDGNVSEKFNELFRGQIESIRNKLSLSKSKGNRKQKLFSSLRSIATQAGYKGDHKQGTIVGLLDSQSRIEYDKLLAFDTFIINNNDYKNAATN